MAAQRDGASAPARFGESQRWHMLAEMNAPTLEAQTKAGSQEQAPLCSNRRKSVSR